MLNPINIGNVNIKPPIILAPMSGITGKGFRQLIREENEKSVGLFVTEFVSSEGAYRRNKPTLRLMKKSEADKNDPFAIQIFGNDPFKMSECAKIAEQEGADIIDINCGCPAPKVVRKGGGADLLKDPLLIGRIVNQVTKSVNISVSVKIRIGWDSTSINALEVSRIIENEGAKMLTVHGRTRMQGYKGFSDWHIIKQIKEGVKIPVIGNGDIEDILFAKEKIKNTGVDGIMIGRAALKDVWIFKRINEYIFNNKKIDFNNERKHNVFFKYVNLLEKDQLPHKAILGKLKQMAVKSFKGKKEGAGIRKNALRSQSIQEFLKYAKEYIEK